MHYSRILAVLMISFLALPALAAAQSGFMQRGLYDVEHIRLSNGFQVILKQQPETRNVAFRLVVNVGTRHFDCAHRETPHLLEHFLFSGTTRHTEAELERLITDHGGTWNAVTGTEHTTFQVDIFDRFAMEGLDALHEIMTDTMITPVKISKAKGIVYREEGGEPGMLRRFLYDLGIGKRAWKKANEWLLPGNGAVCSGLVNMEGITGEDVMNVFKTAYVPANMTLIAVGNYDRARLLDRLIGTFGSLSRAPKPAMKIVIPPPPASGPAAVSSMLSPFFGSSGSFSVAFRTEGRDHSDAAPLIVLSSYLNAKFYEQVRIKAGLSYAPEAVMFFQPDYGIFYATADIAVRNLARVRELMSGIFETLRRENISSEETERTKNKILLQWAQGYETNAELASLYEERLARAEHRRTDGGMERWDRLPDYEREIAAVNAEDLDRVIALYLQPDRRIDIRSVPTMSYTVFFMLSGGMLLIIALAIGYRLRKARKLKRGMLPVYIRR
jgi:predicted Zn-dependent peptidase